MKSKNNKLYWPPAVTVDVVIFTIENEALKVLLVKRSENPFKGHWSLPGGFLIKHENSKEAASRVLKEKAGVSSVYLEQLYTFDELFRDPRGHVLTVAYFALVPRERLGLKLFQSGQSTVLLPVKRLSKLAFDHKKIIGYALKRLSYKLEYTNAAFSLLPKSFAFSQLQEVYEIVLNKKLDKRNFRKKIIASGLIKPLKKHLLGNRQRPAKLFQFIKQKPIELKRFF